MTDTDREFQSRFDAYRRALSGDVRPPGAETVHRTVLRRQRRRTAVAGALAVVALIVALAQFAIDRGPDSAPIGPPSPSGPSVTAPPSPVTSASPSPSPSSAPPSSKPPSSRAPSSTPPAEQVPPSRSFAVVDGYEMHVVALPEVRLEPVDGLYRGIVYVDVYNSGRQPSDTDAVYITEPTGMRWESPGGTGYPTMGGCVGTAPPETWVCPSEAVPSGGGYRRMPFTVKVNVAPGRTTQTFDGFAIRVMPRDQAGNPTDATPADNKVTVRLILPPA